MSLKPRAMRDVFLERIWQSMSSDPTIFFVSADFGSPVLDKIRSDFPGRFVNVGIAEQNLINVSAGLALEGFKVFAYAIAPFITMRCYEQVRVNIALLSSVRKMNVTLIGVGAGYSYVVSGPTHQCYEDITLMRALPNFKVMSPADHVSAAAMFDVCVEENGGKYIRMDAQILPVVYENAPPDIEKGFSVHKVGTSACLIATGYMLHTALSIAEILESDGISVGVVDLFNLSDFNQSDFLKVINTYDRVISMEEGFSGRGGMDALLFDFFARNGNKAMLNIGVKGSYRFELGTRTELHDAVGIGPHTAMQQIKDFLQSTQTSN